MTSRGGMSLAPDPGAGGAFSFPVLPFKKIIACLTDLQIPVSEEVLTQPEKHREQVVRILERLVEATMGITREEMSQPVFAGLSTLTYPELHEESIPALAFFRAVSKMMRISCVDDFSLKDLIQPNAKRLKRQLSAVINFCKFREERMRMYGELVAEKEGWLAKVRAGKEENERLQDKLEELKKQTAEEAKAIEEVEGESRRLEGEISQLNRRQAEIRQESADLKKTGADLKDRVARAALTVDETRAEKERLQAQIVNSPQRIRREMADQQQALEQERAEGMSTEKEAQRLEMCVGNVTRAEKEVQKAVKAIEEVEVELSKQKDALKEVKATQATVASNRARSVEARASIQNLQRQLNRYEEKMGHLRRQAKLKNEAASENLEGMQAKLVDAGRQRREAESRAEAAAGEAAQLEQKLQAEQEKHEAKMQEMRSVYHHLEGVVLRHHSALRTAMSGLQAPVDFPPAGSTEAELATGAAPAMTAHIA